MTARGAGVETLREQEPPRARADDGELMPFEHHGFRRPMDTPRDKQMLGGPWDSGEARW